MKRRYLIMLLMLAMLLFPAAGTQAQDGLNLPTELYVLLNDGTVQRYGLGAAGVENITDEGLFVLDFAVAPDNTLLAYRTEDGLSVLNLASGLTQEIEDSRADLPPLRGRGRSMVWTPAGDALAYSTSYGVRVMLNTGDVEPRFSDIVVSAVVHMEWSPQGTHLAIEVENNIWWVYRREGTEMVLASALPSSIGASWLDDTRLVFAPDSGGLYAMDLANANAQTELRDTSNLYRLPYAPDAATVMAFTRAADDTITPEGSAYMQRLSLSGGSVSVVETSEGALDLSTIRWAPGGNFLIQFQGGALALVLPLTGQGFTLPVSNAVAYGWGAPFPASVNSFELTYDGFFRAADAFGVMQVWRLPRNGLPAEPLTATAEDVAAYAIADDGSALAYISGGALWLLPIDPAGSTGEATQLGAITWENPDLLALDFSDDSSALVLAYDGTVAYVTLADGTLVTIDERPAPNTMRVELAAAPNLVLLDIGTSASDSIEVVDTLSDSLAPTTVSQSRNALWLSDGRILGYGAQSDESTSFTVFDLATTAGPQAALRLPDAQPLAVREIAPGVLRLAYTNRSFITPSLVTLLDVAVDSGEPDDLPPAGFIHAPQISPDGAYLAGYTGPGGLLVIYNIDQRQTLTLAAPAAPQDFQWASFR